METKPSQSASSKNHLAGEKSPYLIQHADNPVDWHPWGDEAFARARDEDRPVFLSIGYSTCHWCHVMEQESFEDPDVARLMNNTFINIKVDREERPDIDNQYMAVCQMLTGSGGWPLTIILTPDKQPFFAGTYFPRENRPGRIGMLDLVPKLATIWQNRRQDAVNSAAQITETLQRSLQRTGKAGHDADFTTDALDKAYAQLCHSFDEVHGGFGTAPKFPAPHNLLFLLRSWKRTGDTRALRMVTKTLDAMRLGGIYDQIGYGFHRYSTDAEWLLPHFEKMLYDQALLTLAYTETYLATQKPEFRRTAREILTYVLRDMTSPEGGFYSAEDADSEGEEGKFYLWTEHEIRRILPADDADLVLQAYSVHRRGNFADESTGVKSENNILHFEKPPPELATDFGVAEDALQRHLDECRLRLFEERKKRIHPLKDDKILTDWNGLMIAALASASRAFNSAVYKEAAVGAANFILDVMRGDDGRLLHRYRQNEAGIKATLDDYAFLIWGLIELYEATFDIHWLEAALKLSQDQIAHFWDHQQGGFYFIAHDEEPLLLRSKENYDGAVPSGNSVSMLNLARLALITADTDLEKKAHAIGQAFVPSVEQAPAGHTYLLSALDFARGTPDEIVIVGDIDAEDTQALLRGVNSLYLPNAVTMQRPLEAGDAAVFRFAPYLKQQECIAGKATAYVCKNDTCNLPTTNVEEMVRLLK